jgi:acylpyruvate hydrolase
MRLATLKTDGGPVAVVVKRGEAALITDGRGVAAFSDVGDLLRAGQEGMDLAAASSARSTFEPLDEADLLRPILAPEAVVCVGLNYRTHILEMGRELPEHPTLFSKLARSLTDPYADIELPAVSDRVDYEGELGVVIGSGGRNLSLDQAWEAVAGFCVLNDVTVRDYQKRTLQWFAGKTWEASTPFGPTIVTRDEIEDVGALELTVTVNGQQRQRAQIDDLVFDVPALVSDLSKIVTLRPGDLIATGTPGGVGEAMDPKRYLADGDVVEVAITGVGTLTNRFHRAHRSG